MVLYLSLLARDRWCWVLAKELKSEYNKGTAADDPQVEWNGCTHWFQAIWRWAWALKLHNDSPDTGFRRCNFYHQVTNPMRRRKIAGDSSKSKRCFTLTWNTAETIPIRRARTIWTNCWWEYGANVSRVIPRRLATRGSNNRSGRSIVFAIARTISENRPRPRPQADRAGQSNRLYNTSWRRVHSKSSSSITRMTGRGSDGCLVRVNGAPQNSRSSCWQARLADVSLPVSF